MPTKKFETANSWFSAMREQGYEVPITLLQAIEELMKKEKINFTEAYVRLENRISIQDKIIYFK